MFASQHSRTRLCALVLGALALGAPFATRAQTQSTSIAVLPVIVHSMESNDYLREGVADMLASRLGQYAGLGVIRVDDPARAASDDETARTTGRAAGAEWVLYGSFTQFGEGASLDLRCLRVDGAGAPEQQNPRSIFVQSGQVEQIIPQLSNLAERVAAHVHAGPHAEPQDARSDTSANSAAILALRQRLEALEAQRAAAPDVSGVPEAPEADADATPAPEASDEFVDQALEVLRGGNEAADEDATP